MLFRKVGGPLRLAPLAGLALLLYGCGTTAGPDDPAPESAAGDAVAVESDGGEPEAAEAEGLPQPSYAPAAEPGGRPSGLSSQSSSG